MLFSAKAEYACVAMTELASRHGDPKPARLEAIANKHGIPKRFLVQILLDLKNEGLVVSTRGAAGGYGLGRTPDDITLFDVLNAIDPIEQTARQNDQLQPTVYVQNVRSVWARVVEAQHALLKETTLADLVAQSQGLQYVI
jgi:Rrf2 family protein